MIINYDDGKLFMLRFRSRFILLDAELMLFTEFELVSIKAFALYIENPVTLQRFLIAMIFQSTFVIIGED